MLGVNAVSNIEVHKCIFNLVTFRWGAMKVLEFIRNVEMRKNKNDSYNTMKSLFCDMYMNILPTSNQQQQNSSFVEENSAGST
jgi:hypothetical protein